MWSNLKTLQLPLKSARARLLGEAVPQADLGEHLRQSGTEREHGANSRKISNAFLG
jgi:hypothetical protein